MKAYPQNLLVPIILMEWYLIPYEKESRYRVLKAKMQRVFRAKEKEHFIPGESLNSEHDMLNLFNAMAKKRFEAIVRNEGELF